MIAALAALLGCQLGGEILVRALALPLPGPVAGLGLLFAALVVRGRRASPEAAVPAELGAACDALLRNLSLLFIPAAVGVVKYLDLLRERAVPILVAVAVSTTLALLVTAGIFRLVSRLHAFRHASPLQDVERAVGIEGERATRGRDAVARPGGATERRE